MAKLVFETGMIYGDDRGSVIPVGKYSVDVPAKEQDAFLDKVAVQFSDALEQLSERPFDYDYSVYVEEFKPFAERDETEQMLTVWDYDDSKSPVELTRKLSDSVRTLVKDVLLNERWNDFFALTPNSDKSLVDNIVDSINWKAVNAKQVLPTPVKIPVGTLVYMSNGYGPGKATYGGYLDTAGRFSSNGTLFYGKEELFVPVDYVDAFVVDAEVFPLPHEPRNRYNWFARLKTDKKVQAFGRIKKDALFSLKFFVAVKTFWA